MFFGLSTHLVRTYIRNLGCFGVLLLACAAAAGQDSASSSVSVPLGDIARQMSAARAAAEAEGATFEDRIRFATWALMVAEAAVQPHGLVSTAGDLFDEGQEAVDDLLEALAADPEAEKELVIRAPLLAARLDAAVVRRERTVERRELARAEERDRLNQLRLIAKSFRTGMAAQSEAQAWASLGDASKAEANLAEAWTALDDINRAVVARRDFFLLEDEPDIEANPDAQLLTVAPTTFRSSDIVANAKAVAAIRLLWTLERAGESLYDNPKAIEILTTAHDWASAALSDKVTPAGAPEGSSAENVFALFARGRSADLAAVYEAWRSPFDKNVRDNVTAGLSRAAADYQSALDLLSDHDGSALHTRTLACLENLKSPAQAHARVTRLVSAGELSSAVTEAQSMAMRHPDPAQIALYLETARRAGRPIDELQLWCQGFLASGVASRAGADIALRIAAGRLAIDAAANRITTEAWATAPEEVRQQVSRDALLVLESLRAPEGATENESAKLTATRALLVAYAWLASAHFPRAEAVLKAAVEDAQNAEVSLSRSITETLERAPAADVVDEREALVHSRLARGFLAVALLPEYRDEARLAFAAAFDEAGRLPSGGRRHAMLGSPLLTGMLRHGDGDSAKLVAEERLTRQSMTRFVEACLAMEFGSPIQAAEQFRIAQEAAERGRNSAIAADAATLMRAADGFDVAITLPDSMAAFETLGLVASGQHENAIRRAVSLTMTQTSHNREMLANNGAINFAALANVIPEVRSSLVAYALLRALDARLDSAALGQDNDRVEILDALKTCQSRCSELLGTPQQKNRYPHLIELVNASQKEMADPGIFLAAKDLVTVERGLRRHPDSTALWQRYLEYIDRNAGDGPRSSFAIEKALTIIDTLSKEPAVPTAAIALTRAMLLERLARYPLAEQGYASARNSATTAEERVVAASREAVLMVRNAFSGNDTGIQRQSR